jgi:hypothetical protein
MKTLAGLLIKDIRYSFRERFMQYMLIAPIVLALVLRFFFPFSGSETLKFVADSSISSAEIEKIGSMGSVSVVTDGEAVKQRIREMDHVFGFVRENGKLSLLVQGNEPEEQLFGAQQVYISVLIDNVQSPSQIVKSLGKMRSMTKEIVTSMLMMFVLSMAGMIMGFSIVADKESKVIQALAVSPLSLFQYLLSKGLLTLVYGFFCSYAIAWIMNGFDLQWLPLFLVLFPSVIFGNFLGYLIGWLAHNQNTAIAAVKTISTVFVILPMLSLVLPSSYQVFFYVLPGFWILKLIFAMVTNDPAFTSYFVVSLLVSLGSSFVMIPLLSRKLRLRTV